MTEFLGALAARGVTKGVFVTTSDFTRGAQEVVEISHHRIALIDGKELARLMVEHDIGARTQHTYKIKRIDEDYFSFEEI